MTKRRKIPTPSWEHSQAGTLAGRLDTNRWQLFATAGVVLLILAALGVVGWAYLSDYIEDRQRPGSTALEVAGSQWTVRDFAQRAELSVDEGGGQNNAFLVIPNVAAQLITEAILLEFAPAEGVTATDAEIKEGIATRLGITTDDPNFDARFQEELEATGLTAEEYRTMIRAEVLRANLTTKFGEELPEALPSVHYRQIRVADQETADDIIAQLEDGADFATLFAEHDATFTEGDETGGDEGFVPEGLLNEDLEAFIFGLEDGEVGSFPTTSVILIIEKIEESDTEPLTDVQRERLAANAFDVWEQEKQDSIEIKNDMNIQEGDGEKINWVIDHAGLLVQLR